MSSPWPGSSLSSRKFTLDAERRDRQREEYSSGWTTLLRKSSSLSGGVEAKKKSCGQVEKKKVKCFKLPWQLSEAI